MSRAMPRFIPDPRIWNQYQLCARLGMCAQTFKGKQADLEAKGFPRKDPELGGWDGDAVEQWLDERAGLVRDDPDLDDGELDGWEPSR